MMEYKRGMQARPIISILSDLVMPRIQQMENIILRCLNTSVFNTTSVKTLI